MTDFVTIARIVKTRGIRGEVAASLLTDFPERFAQTRRVRLFRDGQEFWEVLEKHWFHQNRVILKFKGRDRPHEVEELVGSLIQVPEDQRVEPPQGSFFRSDLIGCKIFQDGEEIGRVQGFFETGPEGGNLTAVSAAGDEFMIPFARQFVLYVDLDEQRVDVRLPQGLREVAPSAKSKEKRGRG